MRGTFLNPKLRRNQEFQSASIRLGIWGFMFLFLGYARYLGYFDIDWDLSLILFGIHLIWFAGIFVSVLASPAPSQWRRYLAALSDMSGASFLIWMVGDPLSPFYLLYIWSFVSQGARYGSRNLVVAATASVCSYSIVLMALDGWAPRVFEVAFLLSLLVVLPFYEWMLLRRLHDARSSAEAANRARAEFLATMTHELRTPLSAVIGMARLLRGTRLDREQREYVQGIHASADVLQSVVGDILDLSKIDARKLELSVCWFDLRASVYEVVASQSGDAVEKGLELDCRVDPEVPEQARADELRFRQILLNLTSNAVKFTDEGRIGIRVRLAPADAEFTRPYLEIIVEDTGIGMSEAQLEKLFDGFWQADGSSTRRYGGTGLGTTIARELTELMGGRISVTSTEGRGSRFRVRLPILAAEGDGMRAPQPPPGVAGKQVALIMPEGSAKHTLVEVLSQARIGVAGDWNRVGDCDLMIVDVPADSEALLGEVASHQSRRPCPVLYLRASGVPLHQVAGERYTVIAKPPSPTVLWGAIADLLADDSALGPDSEIHLDAHGDFSARVLVAEDDEVNARLIEALLEKCGHRVTLVTDGRQALAAARQTEFDIALIDLRMPVLDGMGFCRRLRALEDGARRLPVVALTANASESVRAACFDAGMDDFVVKPIDPEHLQTMIDTRVGGAAG